MQPCCIVFVAVCTQKNLFTYDSSILSTSWPQLYTVLSCLAGVVCGIIGQVPAWRSAEKVRRSASFI